MTNAPFATIDDYRTSSRSTTTAEAVGRPAMDPPRSLAGPAPRSRDNARTPMQWDAGAERRLHHRHPVDRRSTRTTPRSTPQPALADPDSVFHHYRRLIALRHTPSSCTAASAAPPRPPAGLRLHADRWADAAARDREPVQSAGHRGPRRGLSPVGRQSADQLGNHFRYQPHSRKGHSARPLGGPGHHHRLTSPQTSTVGRRGPRPPGPPEPSGDPTPDARKGERPLHHCQGLAARHDSIPDQYCHLHGRRSDRPAHRRRGPRRRDHRRPVLRDRRADLRRSAGGALAVLHQVDEPRRPARL